MAEEVIYEGGKVRLVIRNIALPNGKNIVRKVVEHPGAVVAPPVDLGADEVIEPVEIPLAEALEMAAGDAVHDAGTIATVLMIAAHL